MQEDDDLLYAHISDSCARNFDDDICDDDHVVEKHSDPYVNHTPKDFWEFFKGDEFDERFRMSRPVFNQLLEEVKKTGLVTAGYK